MNELNSLKEEKIMSVEKVTEFYKNRKQVVTVIWEDTNKYGAVRSISDDFETAFAATTGVLIKDDDRGISVAFEIFDSNDVRDVSIIPRSQIREIIRYKIK